MTPDPIYEVTLRYERPSSHVEVKYDLIHAPNPFVALRNAAEFARSDYGLPITPTEGSASVAVRFG